MKKKTKLSLSVIILLIIHIPLYAKNADDLYREGKYADAEKAYSRGDMDNPKDLRYRYDRGCSAFQNKDYQAATAAFTSVLRRAKDKDIIFRSAYNLGNTAFIQNDFASAAEYYRQAILYNSGSSEAKYNLELALKKLEEVKQNPDNKGNKNGQKNNQKGGDENTQKGEKGKDQKEDQRIKRDNSKDRQGQDKNEAKNKSDSKDLSGNLSAASPENNKSGKGQRLSPAEIMERKKAEALLDNIKEDRAKIMQLQSAGEKKMPRSGKSW